MSKRTILMLVLSVHACDGGGFDQRTQGAGAAASAPPALVIVTRDVEYGIGPVAITRGRKRSLKLDIYQPPRTDSLHPAFIAIHGGGLRRNDKGDENVAQLCSELASRGFVCVSINYRMIPDQPVDASGAPVDVLRAATQDAALAARWLRDNAPSFRVDTARISIGGSSAGAMLAMHVAYGPANPDLRFANVFSWVGDPTGTARMMNAGEPPLFIVHGIADTTVKAAEVLALATRAKQLGLRYEVHVCDSLGHNVPLDRKPGGRSLYDYLADFLRADGRASAPASRVEYEPESCPR